MAVLNVIAMGGNSLIDPEVPPTVENQFALTAQAMGPVVDLIERGERVVITHGNGPQVGFMQLRVELARPVLHEVPLDSLVADTQGSLGYMIQMTLRALLEERGVDAEIVTIVTEIEVAPDDPDFDTPTKPIGKFYSQAEARELTDKHGWRMVEDAHRGYRRVVPSPKPIRIVQLPIIERLLDQGVVVITCGGGGIPVMRDERDHLRGIEGVIDKDRASALLGVELGAQRLLVTTAIDAVYRNFHEPDQEPVREATAAEIRAMTDQFPAGSMRPKMDAALDFLSGGGQEVFVCRPEDLLAALDRVTGTRIVPDPRG
ncbi:MAG: carbamate kinase [Proteobacteria bacterium]|nr:MAG: carbamate kinase [Pseudomonadota bacterium]